MANATVLITDIDPQIVFDICKPLAAPIQARMYELEQIAANNFTDTQNNFSSVDKVLYKWAIDAYTNKEYHRLAMNNGKIAKEYYQLSTQRNSINKLLDLAEIAIETKGRLVFNADLIEDWQNVKALVS